MKVRWLRRDELPLVVELIRDHVSPRHILVQSPALLSWQFPSTELTGEEGVSILGAFDSDTLVGILGQIPHRFHVRGNHGRGHWTGNWFVRTDARRGAPGLQLLGHARRLDALVLGCVGYNDRSKAVFTATRFELQPDVPRLVGVVDVDGTHDLLGSTASRDEVHAHRLRRQPMPPGWTLSTDSAGWDQAWATIANDRIGTVRDEAWIRWRYTDHPVFDYQTLFLRAPDGAPRGFAAVRREALPGGDGAVGRIVDIAGSQDGLGPLAAIVADWAAQAGVLWVDCAVSHRATYAALGTVLSSPQVPFPTRLQPPDLERVKINAAVAHAGAGRDLPSEMMSDPHFDVVRGDGDMDRPRSL